MGENGAFPKTRLRRLRQNAVVRDVIRETEIDWRL